MMRTVSVSFFLVCLSQGVLAYADPPAQLRPDTQIHDVDPHGTSKNHEEHAGLSSRASHPVGGHEGQSVQGKSPEEEFSEKLNAVLSQARDAQLLVKEPSTSDQRQAVSGATSHKAEQANNSHSVVHTQSETIRAACSETNPLDFSGFTEMDSYYDLLPYLEMSGEVGAKRPSWEAVRIAKAYLSLGMSAEAKNILRDVRESEAKPYRKLADLMDGISRPDTAYFLELGSCHEDSGVWLATAMLAAERAEGAAIMSGYLSDFRKLPFQMRATVASLSIPSLERMDQKALAQRLLADFDHEEIAKASRLEFAQALLEMGQGDESSNEKVQAFLHDATFQADALSGMLRNGATLMPAQKDVLLDQMVKIFGQSNDDADIAIRLRFTLQELGAESNYPLMKELAELPALQKPFAQQEIRSQFANAIENDLGSGDSVKVFAAIDMLLNDGGLLDRVDRRPELFAKAVSFAEKSGYSQLAGRLSQNAGQGQVLAEQRAELSFRRKDFDTVYDLASEFPASTKLARLASLAAIYQADSKMLARFEPGVKRAASDILPLIEQDAIEGHWMVSPELYDEARRFTDPEDVRRVERVLALKNAWLNTASAGRDTSIRSMPETLSRSGEAIATMRKEGH